MLIEFEHGAAIITARSTYRELVKQALARTVEELRDAAARESERAQSRRRSGGRERTPA